MWRTLQWRHNGRDNVSNYQPCDCLLNRLFRCRSKETSKLRVTGLCEGNSPRTGEFRWIPAQMASYTEKVSIWWRHNDINFTSPQKGHVFHVPFKICMWWLCSRKHAGNLNFAPLPYTDDTQTTQILHAPRLSYISNIMAAYHRQSWKSLRFLETFWHHYYDIILPWL